MERSIVDVIDVIRKQVPDQWVGLLAGLQSIRESAVYAAPEQMWRQWGRLADLLAEELGPEEPSVEWQRRIGAIVRGEETCAKQ